MRAKQVVSGVILIDKPQGMTSQQVVSKVKYLFQSTHHDSKKAGHTGTLDPMATGLLPVCLGDATKFSQYTLNAYKHYEAIIQLGQQTDTGDKDGQVIKTLGIPNFDENFAHRLKHATRHFLGTQTQIPPMYSALKKDGKKLYELARLGVQIDRPARTINITSLDLQILDNDKIKMRACVSKGTYIRVLGEDIATFLGTTGHLIALRRTHTADFDIADAISLDALENLAFDRRFDWLKNSDECVKFLPKLVLDDALTARVLLGQRLNVKDLATAQNIALDSEQEIRLFGQTNFLGVARLEPTGRLQPVKLIQQPSYF